MRAVSRRRSGVRAHSDCSCWAALRSFLADGNELPTCSSDTNSVEVELSEVRIHGADASADTSVVGGPAAPNTREDLLAALHDARAQVAHLESLLLAHGPPHTPHAVPPNTTHLTHDPHSNQLFAPIVDVDTVLHHTNGTEHAVHTGLPQANGHTAAATGTPQTATDPAHVKSLATSESSASQPACFSLDGIADYFSKFQGQHVATLPMSSWPDILLAFIAGFIGIMVPALLHFNMLHTADKEQYLFLVASFGATAVLLYAAPMSDFSQPRNVILGHAFSSVVGVCVRHLVFPFTDLPTAATDGWMQREWLACALAVSIAITVMNVTKTIHPPGSVAGNGSA